MVSIRNPIKILSANSPLSWSDPSGLAPEKEKKRDRVLTILLRDISNEIANIDRINGADNDAFLSYIRAMSNAKLDIILKYGMAAIHNKLFSGGGGNSPSGGTRVGEGTDGSRNKAENGQDIINIRTKFTI